MRKVRALLEYIAIYMCVGNYEDSATETTYYNFYYVRVQWFGKSVPEIFKDIARYPILEQVISLDNNFLFFILYVEKLKSKLLIYCIKSCYLRLIITLFVNCLYL
uniref:Ribonuclease P RNA n=1 Tax=Dasysiphonia japonica TaxID=2506492 RepID=A0A4D6WR15_9FLOR|nr:ribonuclease P RNA [Dasysiphonia japonica]